MIYIDSLRRYKRQEYCHMASDVSHEELHQFAQSIGVSRRWFHKDHYDLRKAERELAIQNGAKETTSRDLVYRMKYNDTRKTR